MGTLDTLTVESSMQSSSAFAPSGHLQVHFHAHFSGYTWTPYHPCAWHGLQVFTPHSDFLFLYTQRPRRAAGFLIAPMFRVSPCGSTALSDSWLCIERLRSNLQVPQVFYPSPILYGIQSPSPAARISIQTLLLCLLKHLTTSKLF